MPSPATELCPSTRKYRRTKPNNMDMFVLQAPTFDRVRLFERLDLVLKRCVPLVLLFQLGVKPTFSVLHLLVELGCLSRLLLPLLRWPSIPNAHDANTSFTSMSSCSEVRSIATSFSLATRRFRSSSVI